MMRTGQQLAVVRPLTAVEALGDGDYGVVQRIPNNAVVEYCGRSRLRNMVDLKWRDQVYCAFELDVTERTSPLNERNVELSRR
jgi:hypothetical protein